jgi:hypothetical protein
MRMVGYPAPPRLIRPSVCPSVRPYIVTECTIQLTGSPIFDYGIYFSVSKIRS